jgi:hypothetical protein
MSGHLKNLNVQDVVERFNQGDRPVVKSSYSTASVFDDGVEVPHQIMQAAAYEMGLTPPAKGDRWPEQVKACSPMTA